jgi:hypothetical protein
MNVTRTMMLHAAKSVAIRVNVIALIYLAVSLYSLFKSPNNSKILLKKE